MHFKRVMVEQFGQALTIATGLADRVVVTAVLLRMWGNTVFETWSVCLAVSGLISLFEFGFSLYFNNRLMEETEQHKFGQATRTFFIANTLFGAAASLGFLCIVVLVIFSSLTGLQNQFFAKAAVLVLAGGSALRIAATGFLSLYRANRQYGRLVFLQAAGDLVRIAAAITVCLLGGGLWAVALSTTLLAILVQVVIPVTDSVRRFRPHRIGFAAVRRDEIYPVVRTSSAFFAQMIPIVLLTSVPVLYLGRADLAAGVLAAFILMRTLSGVPRALLQQFGAVLGQECGRRIAVNDSSGALKIVTEGARLYSVLSGMATGLLFGAGSQISLLWTGSSNYFRLDYILAAVIPMLAVAFAVLAHNILTTTNAPLFATAGRWLQVTLTVLCLQLLPIEDRGLAMLVALSVGEVFGFAPLAYYGVARLVPGTSVWFHVKEVIVSVAAAALSTAITLSAKWVMGGATAMAHASAIAVAVMVNGGLILWLGIRSRTRQAFIEEFVHPRFAILGLSARGTNVRP